MCIIINIHFIQCKSLNEANGMETRLRQSLEQATITTHRSVRRTKDLTWSWQGFDRRMRDKRPQPAGGWRRESSPTAPHAQQNQLESSATKCKVGKMAWHKSHITPYSICIHTHHSICIYTQPPYAYVHAMPYICIYSLQNPPMHDSLTVLNCALRPAACRQSLFFQ